MTDRKNVHSGRQHQMFKNVCKQSIKLTHLFFVCYVIRKLQRFIVNIKLFVIYERITVRQVKTGEERKIVLVVLLLKRRM